MGGRTSEGTPARFWASFAQNGVSTGVVKALNRRESGRQTGGVVLRLALLAKLQKPEPSGQVERGSGFRCYPVAFGKISVVDCFASLAMTESGCLAMLSSVDGSGFGKGCEGGGEG